jgi:hypothetical protein
MLNIVHAGGIICPGAQHGIFGMNDFDACDKDLGWLLTSMTMPSSRGLALQGDGRCDSLAENFAAKSRSF